MPDSATNDSKSGGYLELIRCENVDGQLRKRGEPFVLSLREAAGRFSPNPVNRGVVLKAGRGAYLGIRSRGKTSEPFVVINSNDDGDISWLLKKYPDLGPSISEVYLVLNKQMPRFVEHITGVPQ